MTALVMLLVGLVAPAVDGIPRRITPLAELSTDALHHREVLRIDRDFGQPRWEIALDGWLPRRDPTALHEVRLWWVDTEQEDRRKPFSAYLRRYLGVVVERQPGGALAVRMAGDRKQYEFAVELDASGTPVVFAAVELADGTLVPRCRCTRGRLLARRVLGIPIGIASLTVRCADGERMREGAVRYREAADTPLYEPQ